MRWELEEKLIGWTVNKITVKVRCPWRPQEGTLTMSYDLLEATTSTKAVSVCFPLYLRISHTMCTVYTGSPIAQRVKQNLITRLSLLSMLNLLLTGPFSGKTFKWHPGSFVEGLYKTDQITLRDSRVNQSLVCGLFQWQGEWHKRRIGTPQRHSNAALNMQSFILFP